MLSNRLKAIIQMVPNAETIADIGCDHGKVAISLIKNQIAKRVICGDISGKSLQKAKKLVHAKRLTSSVSLREGNGLSVLDVGEVDVAVIAGMGGELIVEILNADETKAPDMLVLSCNTASGILRKWLSEHGYCIDNEDLVFENRHFYPVIFAKKGTSDALSDMEVEFGPVLLQKKPKALKYLVKRRIDLTRETRSKISKSDTLRKSELLRDIDERLNKYAEVEKCL